MGEMVGEAVGGPQARSVSASRGVRTQCLSHCVSCGECFSGDAAFDAHRTGSPRDRRCSNPERVKRLVVKTEAGTCSLSNGPTKVGVTVWALVGWDKARERAA